MPTIKPVYGTSTAVIFTSLQGLVSAAGSGAESAVIDNTSTLYSRLRIHGRFSVGVGTLGEDMCIYVFAYPIQSDPSGAALSVGTDQIPQMVDQTLPRTNPSDAFVERMAGVQLIATVPVLVAACTIDWSCLIERLPPKLGLYVRNCSNISLVSKPASPASWAASHAYSAGDLVQANAHLYLCTVSGTSGGSAPSWPMSFGTVADGSTIVWRNLGPTSACNEVFYQGENDQIA